MADDTSDKPELEYYGDFQDVVSQRVIAFCNLAQVAETAKDPSVKDLCLTLMRKVNATIRTPPAGEIRALPGQVRQAE